MFQQSCLWRWLPLRLTKRQSALTSTVLLSTQQTWTIYICNHVTIYFILFDAFKILSSFSDKYEQSIHESLLISNLSPNFNIQGSSTPLNLISLDPTLSPNAHNSTTLLSSHFVIEHTVNILQLMFIFLNFLYNSQLAWCLKLKMKCYNQQIFHRCPDKKLFVGKL